MGAPTIFELYNFLREAPEPVQFFDILAHWDIPREVRATQHPRMKVRGNLRRLVRQGWIEHLDGDRYRFVH